MLVQIIVILLSLNATVDRDMLDDKSWSVSLLEFIRMLVVVSYMPDCQT